MTDFTTVILNTENPVRHIAQTLMREHRASLPDLNHIVILLSGYQSATRLKSELLRVAAELNISALLLPRICTLHDYLNQLVPPPDHVIPQEQGLLLLVDALHKHRHLYGASNPWLLAADLLKLFDELTLYRINLPQTALEFADLLAHCYRIEAGHPALLKEAQIVHALWRAWHQQLQAEGWTDAGSHYLRQLGESLLRLPHAHFYVAGFNRFIPAEAEWLRALAQQRPLCIMVNGDADESGLQPRHGFQREHAGHPFDGFLQAALNPGHKPLLQRAQAFASVHARSPAVERIRMQPANSFEHEIQLAALEVQCALQRGDRYIGVITEDRKLARRLRAYLERTGIELKDTTGWALSTTRAVALLENWLQCIENNFPHHAFLDLLKSSASDDDDLLKLIYRFETDIVLHENIGSGMQRYRKAIQSRARRLPWWNNSVQQQLAELLDRHEQAAEPLHKLLQQTAPADAYAQGLLRSLQQLQLDRLLAADEAGRQVLSLLDRVQRSASAIDASIEWLDFRIWLGYTLETHYFSPATGNPHVQLLNLQQSLLQAFDTLIIAAADENHIPGPADTLPFFNDAVRSALKLPDWEQKLRERQYQFRCLLESNPRIFVSWQRESNGEPVAPSPWFEIINYFHATAYGQTLMAPGDQTLLTDIPRDIHLNDDITLAVPERPQPSVAAAAVPVDITVSSHQRLLNCPYQFFVYDILQLKAVDEIRQALQKSDYGERVHRCLHAFHCGIEGISGPFKHPITQQNREQAVRMLQEIALEVFTDDIEDNFLHRGWLQRWLAHIPDYIDWQLEHNIEWTVENAEQQYQIALDANLSLRGRIDRIERRGEKIALMDYKTGGMPSLDDVLTGEDVQLPSYSLLREDVVRVQYLGLDRKKIEDQTVIEGEQLQELRLQVRTRLIDAMNRIRAGAPLPALGQPPLCDYCDASGLCRRKVWQRQKQEQPE